MKLSYNPNTNLNKRNSEKKDNGIEENNGDDNNK